MQAQFHTAHFETNRKQKAPNLQGNALEAVHRAENM